MLRFRNLICVVALFTIQGVQAQQYGLRQPGVLKTMSASQLDSEARKIGIAYRTAFAQGNDTATINGMVNIYFVVQAKFNTKEAVGAFAKVLPDLEKMGNAYDQAHYSRYQLYLFLDSVFKSHQDYEVMISYLVPAAAHPVPVKPEYAAYYCSLLNDLSACYDAISNLSLAVATLERYAKVVADVWGKDAGGYAYIESQIGLRRLRMAELDMDNLKNKQYLLAYDAYTEAKKYSAYLQLHGKEAYTEILMNYGLVCSRLKKNTQAETLLNQAYALSKTLLDTTHNETLSLYLSNLTKLLVLRERLYGLDSTGRLINEAMDIHDRFPNSRDTTLAVYLEALGHTYQSHGLFEMARISYENAAYLFRQTNSSESLRYGMALSEVADTELQLDRFRKAINDIDNALRILLKSLNYDSVEVIQLMVDKMTAFQRLGEIDRAKETFATLIGIAHDLQAQGKKIDRNTLKAMGYAAYKLRLNADAKRYLTQALHEYELSGRSDESTAETLIYLAWVNWQDKNFGPETSQYFIKALQNIQHVFFDQTKGLSPKEAQTYKYALSNVRDMMLSFYLQSPNPELAQAIVEGGLFQKGILLRKMEPRPFQGYEGSTLTASVQHSLGSGEVAVDFIHYRNWEQDSTGGSYYGAFLIRPFPEQPLFVQLCQEATLDSLLFTDHVRLINPDRFYPNNFRNLTDTMRRLKAIIWNKLLQAMGNKAVIYYSADASLTDVSMPGLADTNGFLGETKKMISLLSLAELPEVKREGVAHLHYFTFIGGVSHDTLVYNPNDKSDPMQFIRFATKSANKLKKEGDPDYQPEYRNLSDREVKSLMKKVVSRGRFVKQYLSGTDVTKSALRSLSEHQPDVLHISTHGFYYPALNHQNLPDYDFAGLGEYALSTDPMERCGLVLSNANQRLVMSTFQDGMMTAKELAAIDLHKTRLVVLSACETGQGELTPGEGVFGLQRAFRIAGIKYILTSIYEVTEDDSKLFMDIFYDELLTKPTILEAFNAAQRDFRTAAPDNNSWASWTLLR